MTIELLYTSAAQGLKQGSRGFCTVICTAGLPINLAQRLEALSGYRHLYQPGDQRSDDNPVCYSHVRLAVGGKTLSILSRVGAYGVDYSQRTNKIAHHVVFDGPVPECGPAAVLAQSCIMRTNWDGECKTLQSGPEVSSITVQPAPCKEWKRITGDAGWAGVVANAWMQPTGKPVWIVFSESQSTSLLELMQEATAILPESRRWQATFSTYCTNLPPDVECRVRCVIAGSDEARMSIARGTVLDLTKPMGVAPDSDATAAARNGYTVGSIRMPASAQETAVSDFVHENDSIAATEKNETEYRLKRELPDYSPPAINKGKFKRVENERVASPKSKLPIWKSVSTIVAGLMIVFATVGIASYFYFTLARQSAVSKNIAPEKGGPSDVENSKDGETNTGESSSSSSKQSDMETAKKHAALADAEINRKWEIKLSNNNSTPDKEFKVLESDVTGATYKLANIDIPGLPDLDWLKKTKFHPEGETLPEIFEASKGELFLRSKELAQLRSKTYTISVNYKDGDIQSEPFKFKFTFTNVNDPNIELRIVDSKSSQGDSYFQKGDFAEGTILTANVTKDDRDEIPDSRKWSWYSQNSGSHDQWQPINGASEQSYQVRLEPDTGKELQSRLEYSSNNPESESDACKTVVKSQVVQILEPSKGTILIPQNGVESIDDLNVSVAFRRPQFDKLSVDSKPGKPKMVDSYKPVEGVKIGIKANVDTDIPLKSLVPKTEIEKLRRETQTFLNATRDFASTINDFRTAIRAVKSKSKNSKQMLTIEKLLFKEDSNDPMDLILGYLENHEKAAQLIRDTRLLNHLRNTDKDKLNNAETVQLDELVQKFIKTDGGYPKINNRSFLMDMDISPEKRILSEITFKLFWDAKISGEDAALLFGINNVIAFKSFWDAKISDKVAANLFGDAIVANVRQFKSFWKDQPGLHQVWTKIDKTTFVSQRDSFTQSQFGANANGKIFSTEVRSEEMGPNTKPFLEFQILLDVKIKLRPELVEKTPKGSSADNGSPLGKSQEIGAQVGKP